MQTELFPSFQRDVVRVQSEDGPIDIPYVVGGNGPPLLLLHGFPQTHAMWHKVAPVLAQSFTVVATDHDRFSILGHDRGARVGHRLALDHPQAVERYMALDIAPTLSMYENTDLTFATVYWHWFFLIQKAPLPETLIGADPEFMLRSFMGGRHAGMQAFAPTAWAEYVRVANDPAAVHAMCQDYRASVSEDLEHDRADRARGHHLQIPVSVLWGEFGGLARCFEPLERWKDYASNLRGRALPCGHYIAEEQPDLLVREALDFFQG
jgi:haloacetate dehalogenase